MEAPGGVQADRPPCWWGPWRPALGHGSCHPRVLLGFMRPRPKQLPGLAAVRGGRGGPHVPAPAGQHTGQRGCDRPPPGAVSVRHTASGRDTPSPASNPPAVTAASLSLQRKVIFWEDGGAALQEAELNGARRLGAQLRPGAGRLAWHLQDRRRCPGEDGG